MADDFKSEFTARLGWDWTVDGGNPTDKSELKYNKSLLLGGAVNQAEAQWSETDRVILEGASETFDLTSLTRTVFSGTLTTVFQNVKGLLIVNTSTSGGHLLVGNAAANEWVGPFGAAGDTIKVPLDSPVMVANRQCGWLVDDSNKNLKIAAVNGDVTYSITIVGVETISGVCTGPGSGSG